MPSRRIALDTNFLVNLAGGNETCLDCLDTLKGLKDAPQMVVTPTVLHELADQSLNGETQEEKDLATTALRSMIGWGINPLNFVPVGHGIIETIADRMRTMQLLPYEERNDSFVIAEAALSDCNFLISSDGHIADIDQIQLGTLLTSHHVKPVAILRPKQIVRLLGKG